MTEITRVPLQPIAKGSLVKLWLGVALAIMLGAGIAWAAVPQGVDVDTLAEGTGASPGAEDVVFVHYTGKLADGTVFDESQPLPLPVQGIFPDGFPMPLADMVPGFREGAMQMKKGGKYRLTIPANKAYGAEGRKDPQTGQYRIPPGADLIFDVELVDFMSRPDFERRVQVLQQMMQMQQGAPGAGEQPQPAQ
jgi:FKBP-type peptidyl-prolyl cis-trans isomerase FkpA